jgi:uncharacterized protein
MQVARLLRAAREGAELSQAALAGRAGTSQSAVARYERGTATPSLITIERLLAACGLRLVLDAEPAAARLAVSYSTVRQHRSELLSIARRHGARNVRMFGSTARGDARRDSDVDLIVDLEPRRTLLDIAALRRETSQLLGRSVDIATTDTLREPLRREIERDAVPV